MRPPLVKGKGKKPGQRAIISNISNNSSLTRIFENTFEKVGRFVEEFKARHGKLNCHQLIGLNVFSEEGLKEFMEKNVKLTQCIRYVEDAVGIVEGIISRNPKPAK